jgi:hypothetical protein
MPRSARLDMPAILQHVIIRGIERHQIFRDGAERKDVRLGTLVPETGTWTHSGTTCLTCMCVKRQAASAIQSC